MSVKKCIECDSKLIRMKFLKLEVNNNKKFKCPIKGCVSDLWHDHYLCYFCQKEKYNDLIKNANISKKYEIKIISHELSAGHTLHHLA